MNVFDEYGNYKYPSDVELTEPNTATSMPSGDLISRQAVLELVADYDLSMGQVVKGIHALPPVNPQPKTGHWKEFTHSAYHGVDDDNEPIWREVKVYHCSECNRRTVIKENFCPNCGARMESDHETDN